MQNFTFAATVTPFTVYLCQSMKSASVKPSSNSFGVVPPSNFSYVEENICRCTFPISRHNLSFIQSTSLNYIINISGRKHDQAVLTYFEEKNIEVVRMLTTPSQYTTL